ncbi:MAG: dihydrodipicolinate synthase family protein [Armatimonadetes bacterium]|nr:dihydrodipicolinate synthase family protein [Armatimonadota bacterium]MDW8027289.1 dihydrodipicolinate synthase family protein [Armatimonadota bacterium]
MATVNWRGVFPAVTTQFRSDFSLDIEETLRHIDILLNAGVHGLVMLGTVGENCSVEFHEKVDLLKAVVAHVNKRVPVLTGIAEYTTSLACRFAEAAQSVGVDGLMVLPAMVYKSDKRETIVHFRTIAKATDLPIMIYNNPVAYGVDITPEMFAEMADETKFVAIKESSGDVRRFTDIVNFCGDRYILFCGIDDLLLESVAAGAVGWIGGLVNPFPEESTLLWNLLERGDFERARQVYRWFMPLLHFDSHPKLVQLIKLAMALKGYGREFTRPPRLALEGEERNWAVQRIKGAIETSPFKKQRDF